MNGIVGSGRFAVRGCDAAATMLEHILSEFDCVLMARRSKRTSRPREDSFEEVK